MMLALPKHLNRDTIYDGTSRICSCIYLMNLDLMVRDLALTPP